MYNDKFMKQALSWAKKSEDVPIGAVLVNDGVVVASACNTGGPMHAEMNVLNVGWRLLKHDISKCSMYVTLEPCDMCIAAIRLCNINELFFGAFSYNTEPHSDLCVIGGCREAESAALINNFFADKRD